MRFQRLHTPFEHSKGAFEGLDLPLGIGLVRLHTCDIAQSLWLIKPAAIPLYGARREPTELLFLPHAPVQLRDGDHRSLR